MGTFFKDRWDFNMWLQFLNNHKTCTRNMKGIMTAYLVKKKQQNLQDLMLNSRKIRSSSQFNHPKYLQIYMIMMPTECFSSLVFIFFWGGRCSNLSSKGQQKSKKYPCNDLLQNY